MKISRRDVLKTGSALACTPLMAADPELGLILPPAGNRVPEEAHLMYPSGVRFRAQGLGLKTMTPAGYDAVIERIVPVSQELAKNGANAIIIFGTSLTFYKGAAFNRSLITSVHQATSLPATSMSTAVVEGLRAVGGRKLVVPTAYDDEVNRRLRIFLEEEGFQVLTVKGLGIEAVGDINRVTPKDLLDFCAHVREGTPQADAMLVSCGGLPTLEILAPLEKRCKLPVVSSAPHALWAGVRLLGLSGRSPGFGSLLDKG